MQIMKSRFFLATLVVSGLLVACKKTDLQADGLTPVTPTTPVVSGDAMKDSVLAYTRDIYLWYNQVPGTFNARSYSDPDKIMGAIRQYSIEPGFPQAVDRWSFGIKKADWDNASAGVGGDFGMTVFFKSEGDLRVRSVEPASPAGRAGIRRGWRLTRINGNENITTSNSNFIIQQVYQSSNSAFSFQKPDNSTVSVTLQAGSYREKPITFDSLYQVNGKSIGYFVFPSFLGDTTEIYSEFNRLFNGYASAGVKDLVIDLRYNGGGYVSVAEKLSNFIIPSSSNGQLMMKQTFNDKYTQYNTTENFRKLGNLQVDRVFFIVSNNTASASELVINNLKPHMNVLLIGPNKTYGKPVGFFPIPVADWYIFPVSFKTVNKNGEGNYYGGLSLNHQAADGLDKDWGDVNESALRSAISYIAYGVYPEIAPGARVTQPAAVIAGNTALDKTFKGTVDPRGLK